MSSQDLYSLTNTRQLEEIRNWQDLNGAFYKHSSFDALKLLEEVVELCYESGCRPEQVNEVVGAETQKHASRGGFGKASNRGIMEEYGDVLACVVAYRNKLAIRSVDCLQATLEKIRGRSWVPDKGGILRRPR